MWWTWTAPRTAPWPTLTPSPPLSGQGGLYIEVGGGIRDGGPHPPVPGSGCGPVHPGHHRGEGLRLHGADGPEHTATGSPWAWTPGTATWPSAAGRSCPRKRAWTSAAACGTPASRPVIYTDISRDGAEQGTNLDLYRELASDRGPGRSPPPAASAALEELRELQADRDQGRHSGQGPVHRAGWI